MYVNNRKGENLEFIFDVKEMEEYEDNSDFSIIKKVTSGGSVTVNSGDQISMTSAKTTQ